MRITDIRTAGILGLLFPVILTVVILASAMAAPWFSWTGNCLSDLGGLTGEVLFARGLPSVIFSLGLMICGVVGFLMTLGLMKADFMREPLADFGGYVLLLGMAALFGVGLLAEPVGPLHFYVSVLFYTITPVAILIIGVSLTRSRDRFGWLALAVGLLGIYGVTIPTSNVYCSVNEIISALPVMIFMAAFGLRLLKSKSKPNKPESVRDLLLQEKS